MYMKNSIAFLISLLLISTNIQSMQNYAQKKALKAKKLSRKLVNRVYGKESILNFLAMKHLETVDFIQIILKTALTKSDLSRKRNFHQKS